MHMVAGWTPWYSTKPVIGCYKEAMPKQFYSEHHIGFTCMLNSPSATFDLFNGPSVYYFSFPFFFVNMEQNKHLFLFLKFCALFMYIQQQPAVP